MEKGEFMFSHCPKCSFAVRNSPAGQTLSAREIKCPRCATAFSPEKEAKEPMVFVTPPQAQASAFEDPLPLDPEEARLNLRYMGKGTTLSGIYVKTILLSIFTLGVYNFWGKIKVRKYLYSQSEFLGDKFTFTGTGKELFYGWLRASAVLMIIFGIPRLLAMYVNDYLIYSSLLFLPFIAPVALVGTRRYRLSRTFWRGIQFSFRGSLKEGLLLYLKGTLLSIATLGIYTPFFYVTRQAFWRNNTWFGNSSFRYDPNDREIFGTYIKGMLLVLLTFGIYWFWLQAKLARLDWESTSFGNVKFTSTMTGGKLFKLHFTNFLLMVVTLGLAYPWVIGRNMEFAFTHLTIEGTPDVNRVKQSAQTGQATGEGLLNQFDMDFGF